MAKIHIDPVTRLEGHLAVGIDTDDGIVTDAQCAGEMFRGFEVLLKGRDPLDAQHITQRICGVCPVSHGTASTFAQEAAYKLTPPANGRIIRNLILSANYLQSHISHFYLLAALDYVDVKAVLDYSGNDPDLQSLRDWVKAQAGQQAAFPGAPLLPHYKGDFISSSEINVSLLKHYADALKIRALCHHLVALFGGKIPHVMSIVPGGVTQKVTVTAISRYATKLRDVKRFIENTYVNDAITLVKAYPRLLQNGKAYPNYLAYGVFPQEGSAEAPYLPGGALFDGKLLSVDDQLITEGVRYSFYEPADPAKPLAVETKPQPGKEGAYSWVRAPRYDGKPVEVGPLARLLIADAHGHSDATKILDWGTTACGIERSALHSTMGRHLARALEARLIVEQMENWLSQLRPGEPVCAEAKVPERGEGRGMTEAPRGALGHWIRIEDHRIARYQCIVPTTWNCSPRDEAGQRGPVEQALIGTAVPDKENPLEAVRVVRAFDPCLACAVH